MLQLLTDKLPIFWKLAQNYTDASDEKYLEQQDDINVSHNSPPSFIILTTIAFKSHKIKD